ncbi:MAG: mechanosensitive ion channel family protein [Pseudomonadales bacterium]|nr:mechanosensitive ion channel family protein [Pseudomonadales bacterium]
MNQFLDFLSQSVPLLATLATVVLSLAGINWFLRRRWENDPDAQFRFQLIMLSLTLAGVLAVIIALPIANDLKGQLLGLIGILLSAAVALSSTTFIGNIMAGAMLKVVKNARPGDFVTVADLTGRISEMDLLHTEIQTEFRDLVTVPNLYMVTNPLKVVRASGSIISAEISLGYDVPNGRIVELLRDATASAGLKDGFVHIRELGDYSVVYRAAGLLEDIQSLISARSKLLTAMLDALHAAGIEIVSPNFMNTRSIPESQKFIPAAASHAPAAEQNNAETIAFDKAEEAASIEKIRAAISAIDEQLKTLAEGSDSTDGQQRSEVEERKARLLEQLKQATDKIDLDDSGAADAAP